MMKAIVNKPIPARFLARIRTLILAALPAFLCAGCQDVVSTSPLAGEGQAILDDRLLGTWVEPADPADPREPKAADDPADEVIVERGAGDRYHLTSFEDGEAQEFSANSRRSAAIASCKSPMIVLAICFFSLTAVSSVTISSK